MQNYKILTEGKFVGAMRNPGKGKTIELTDAQAAQPLRQMHIEPVSTTKKAAAVEKKVDSGPKKEDSKGDKLKD